MKSELQAKDIEFVHVNAELDDTRLAALARDEEFQHVRLQPAAPHNCPILVITRLLIASLQIFSIAANRAARARAPRPDGGHVGAARRDGQPARRMRWTPDARHFSLFRDTGGCLFCSQVIHEYKKICFWAFNSVSLQQTVERERDDLRYKCSRLTEELAESRRAGDEL